MNSEKTNVLVQCMKQNRKNQIQQYYKYNNICYKIEICLYKNGCNFATEIRKDSDWDKKVRGGI